MKFKLKFTTRQVRQRFKEREVELTEQDVQRLIDEYLYGVDDLQVSVQNFLDYLKDRGEFASYIEMAARHEEMRDLANGVAIRAFAEQPDCEVVGEQNYDDGPELDFRFVHLQRIL